jgi:hypothetical protein
MFPNYDDYEDWYGLNNNGLSDFQQVALNDALRENDMEAAGSTWDNWGDSMWQKRPPTRQQCDRWDIDYDRGLNLWAEINNQPTRYKGKPQPRRADFTHRREYMGARALWELQNRPEEPSDPTPKARSNDLPF